MLPQYQKLVDLATKAEAARLVSHEMYALLGGYTIPSEAHHAIRQIAEKKSKEADKFDEAIRSQSAKL